MGKTIPPPPPSTSRWASFATTYTSSTHLDWRTPRSLFDHLDREFAFTLDAAADKTNHLCDRWLGPGGVHEDALSVSWALNGAKTAAIVGGRRIDLRTSVFLNPPYGRSIAAWYAKAAEEAERPGVKAVVMLVNANTETEYWWDHVWQRAAEIRFLYRRVNFDPPPGYKPRKDSKGREKKDAQTKGSAVIVYRPERLVPYPVVSCIKIERKEKAT